MGRTALIIIIALAATFGYIGSSIRGASRSLMDTHASYLNQTNARNLARLGIHRFLRYKDGQALPAGLQHPMAPSTVAFNGGAYKIDSSSSGNGDILNLNSIGTFDGVSDTIKAKFKLTPRPVPVAAGALGINTKLKSFSIAGNGDIDGRNYDETGSTLVGSGDMPGVTAQQSADTTKISPYSSSIQGAPKINVNSNQEDPQNYLDTYEAAASYKYDLNNPPPNNMTWGSRDNPTIVTMNAQGDTTYGLTIAGQATGYGILVIEGGGSVHFSGQFQWYGLMIVYGVSSTLDFQVTGSGNSGQIVGGVIIAGNSTNQADVKLAGKANIKYSKDALTKATNIKPLTFYRILNWYE